MGEAYGGKRAPAGGVARSVQARPAGWVATVGGPCISVSSLALYGELHMFRDVQMSVGGCPCRSQPGPSQPPGPPSLTVMLGPARWQRQPPHQHCGPGARQLTHLHPHRAASWAPGGRAVTPGREESPSSSGSMLASSPSLASGHVRPVHAASLGSREPSPTGRRSWDQWASTQGGCLQLTLWTGTMLAPSGTCWALFGKLSFLLQTVFPRGGTRPLST